MVAQWRRGMKCSSARCKELAARLNKRYDNRLEKKEVLEAVLAYVAKHERGPASSSGLGKRCSRVWGCCPSNLLYALGQVTDGPLKVN